MKKSALMCIVAASIGWGTSGIFVDCLTPFGLTSLHMTFIRSLAMLLSMLVYVLICDRGLFRISYSSLILTLGSGLAFFGTASCYFYSMVKSSVSTAVVLMYTAPIFVMIYSVLFLGEKLTKVKIFCVAIMLLGCCLVSGIIGGFRFDAVGMVFGLLSGICYSTYNILTKIQMKKGINPITANLYGFLFASAIGALTANVVKIPMCVAGNVRYTIPIMMLLGLCTSVMPYLCYSYALKTIPAGTASSLAILEPMSATLLSVTILGEDLLPLPAVGIALILCSVFILSRQSE